jgi:glycosyltransferase involved in cell wall biosynthesis
MWAVSGKRLARTVFDSGGKCEWSQASWRRKHRLHRGHLAAERAGILHVLYDETGRKRTATREDVTVPTIALMLESDGPGGAEQVLLHLAEEMHGRGHEVVPVGPANGCGWLGEEFRNRGFDPATFRLRWPIDPACVTGLVRLFRDRRVELAHSHEFTMAVYGAAAARATGIPNIITMHGGKGWTKRWRRRLAMRWAFRASSGMVAVSDSTRLELVRVLGTSRGIDVVPNGVSRRLGDRESLRRELGLPADDVLVVAVGNLYPVKGHANLLRALAGVRVELRWRLVIAGRGEEERRLLMLASDLGILDRVHLLGYRADIPDILAAADVFAMPSLSEGLPLALIEAMFAARAIVASGVGGIPDALEHGREGILVPAGDIDALGTALQECLSDPDLRTKMGTAAQQRAEVHFTTTRMADQYERLYRRCLTSQGHGGPPPTAPDESSGDPRARQTSG